MRIMERIIKAAGGQSELARQLDIRQQSVYEWVLRGRVPAERVLEVERITGVSRHEIRPDLYPLERVASARF
jgi:DNA-binding transcriptional regulator YdaS (Cro superfamily)